MQGTLVLRCCQLPLPWPQWAQGWQLQQGQASRQREKLTWRKASLLECRQRYGASLLDVCPLHPPSTQARFCGSANSIDYSKSGRFLDCTWSVVLGHCIDVEILVGFLPRLEPDT